MTFHPINTAMNCKTREEALDKLAEANGGREKAAGVVWQYAETEAWNWATPGSGCFRDLTDTCDHVKMTGRLNPNGPSYARIDVKNVEWVKDAQHHVNISVKRTRDNAWLAVLLGSIANAVKVAADFTKPKDPAEVSVRVHFNRNDWSGGFINIEAGYDEDGSVCFVWTQGDYHFQLTRDLTDRDIVESCGPQWILTGNDWERPLQTFTQNNTEFDRKRGWAETDVQQLTKAVVWICNHV